MSALYVTSLALVHVSSHRPTTVYASVCNPFSRVYKGNIHTSPPEQRLHQGPTHPRHANIWKLERKRPRAHFYCIARLISLPMPRNCHVRLRPPTCTRLLPRSTAPADLPCKAGPHTAPLHREPPRAKQPHAAPRPDWLHPQSAVDAHRRTLPRAPPITPHMPSQHHAPRTHGPATACSWQPRCRAAPQPGSGSLSAGALWRTSRPPLPQGQPQHILPKPACMQAAAARHGSSFGSGGSVTRPRGVGPTAAAAAQGRLRRSATPHGGSCSLTHATAQHRSSS